MSATSDLIRAFERLPHGHFLKALTITVTEQGQTQLSVCNHRLYHASVVGDSVEDCAEQILAIFGEGLYLDEDDLKEHPGARQPKPEAPRRRKLFDD